MRILFYRYHSICEPDILEAFSELGVETLELEHTEPVTDSEHQTKPWEFQIRQVSAFLSEHPVDAVFSINFFPFISEICNIFHLRYISWIVDAPVMELYYKSIRNPWNRVFIFDRELSLEIESKNPGHIFHQPLAANVKKIQNLLETQTKDQRTSFSHDIVFVGSLYSEKSPYREAERFLPEAVKGYLDGVMRVQEQLYGSWLLEEDGILSDDVVDAFIEYYPDFYRIPFENELSPRRTLAQLYLGNEITAREREHTFQQLSSKFPVSIYTGSDTGTIPGIQNCGLANSMTEMPLIFHDSSIVLNLTSKPIRSGIPLRVFDILSCGGFCISNYQEELPELFRVGEEVVLYENYEDLIDKCEYYLHHDKERMEIAEAGNCAIANHYTYERILTNILLQAFES